MGVNVKVNQRQAEHWKHPQDRQDNSGIELLLVRFLKTDGFSFLLLLSAIRVAPGFDAEFRYRVRIVDVGAQKILANRAFVPCKKRCFDEKGENDEYAF